MPPRISVIILTTDNQCDTTLRCLAALTPLPRDIEVILVDNGSADNAADKVSALYPGIITMRNNRNLGVACGRNIGIRHASGDYIMFLDNDTIPSVNALNALAGYLDSHPSCALVAPRLIDRDGNVQRSFRPYPGLLEKIRSAIGVISDIVPPCKVPDTPVSPLYVIGAAQLVRRSVFDRIGPLDSRIFYGPEDADLCLRIWQSSIGSVICLHDVVITHDWRRASRRLFSPLWWKHLRSLARFYFTHRRLL